MLVQIAYDPLKRPATLAERGLDSAGPVFEFEDRRADYGERRIIAIGLPKNRMVMAGWTAPAMSSRCERPTGENRTAMPTDFARLDATNRRRDRPPHHRG